MPRVVDAFSLGIDVTPIPRPWPLPARLRAVVSVVPDDRGGAPKRAPRRRGRVHGEARRARLGPDAERSQCPPCVFGDPRSLVGADVRRSNKRRRRKSVEVAHERAQGRARAKHLNGIPNGSRFLPPGDARCDGRGGRAVPHDVFAREAWSGLPSIRCPHTASGSKPCRATSTERIRARARARGVASSIARAGGLRFWAVVARSPASAFWTRRPSRGSSVAQTTFARSRRRFERRRRGFPGEWNKDLNRRYRRGLKGKGKGKGAASVTVALFGVGETRSVGRRRAVPSRTATTPPTATKAVQK